MSDYYDTNTSDKDDYMDVEDDYNYEEGD